MIQFYIYTHIHITWNSVYSSRGALLFRVKPSNNTGLKRLWGEGGAHTEVNSSILMTFMSPVQDIFLGCTCIMLEVRVGLIVGFQFH